MSVDFFKDSRIDKVGSAQRHKFNASDKYERMWLLCIRLEMVNSKGNENKICS